MCENFETRESVWWAWSRSFLCNDGFNVALKNGLVRQPLPNSFS